MAFLDALSAFPFFSGCWLHDEPLLVSVSADTSPIWWWLPDGKSAAPLLMRFMIDNCGWAPAPYLAVLPCCSQFCSLHSPT
jgi:hypothetical protein